MPPATAQYGPGRPKNGPTEPVILEIVRPLSEADLALVAGIQRGDQGGRTLAPIARLAARHHKAAQLICLGKTDVEVSILTGYTPQHVRNLKVDPTFGELMRYYSLQRDAVLVDVVEQMKTAGTAALLELQDRLETNPGSWTKKDLMEYIKVTLSDPIDGARKNGVPIGGAPVVNLKVSFVESPYAKTPLPLRDVTPEIEYDDQA